MATNLENLQTSLANLTAKLAEVTACPKPTYSIDGQSVSWNEYYSMLTKAIDEINELILKFDPYFIKSVVV